MKLVLKIFLKVKLPTQQKKKKTQPSGCRLPTSASIRIISHQNKRNGRVDLLKIGVLKHHKSREVEGEIRSATLSRDGNSFYVSFLSKLEIPNPQTPNSSIGLDRGIAHTIVTSKSLRGGRFLDLDSVKNKKIELRT